MKKIKKFESFKINEFYNEFTNTKNSDQYPDDKTTYKLKYDKDRILTVLIDDINNLLIKLDLNIINDLKNGKIKLSKLETKYEDDLIISNEIDDLLRRIYEYEIDNQKNESVGDLKTSFIDINLDETELETSDDKTKKLEQEPGKIIIENPSKTDAYNAKLRLGGEITIDPKYPEKQIHHFKKFNEFK